MTPSPHLDEEIQFFFFLLRFEKNPSPPPPPPPSLRQARAGRGCVCEEGSRAVQIRLFFCRKKSQEKKPCSPARVCNILHTKKKKETPNELRAESGPSVDVKVNREAGRRWGRWGAVGRSAEEKGEDPGREGEWRGSLRRKRGARKGGHRGMRRRGQERRERERESKEGKVN